jgi:hypothetical protein
LGDLGRNFLGSVATLIAFLLPSGSTRWRRELRPDPSAVTVPRSTRPCSTGTGNALVESTNTKLRVIHRRAYGFRTPGAMIALGMLALGGLCPDLPGRPTRTLPAAA